tara:strand:- start:3406 stop:4317 length:912 start_codon:yes stop_codon:yes gene_type:complete
MPLPAPTPSVPNSTTWNVSGGGGYTGNASGIPAVSGAASGLGTLDSSGPWFIETQSMEVEYFRYPTVSRARVSNADFALSGYVPAVNVVSGYQYNTALAAKVNVTYTATKSYDRYTTSSYTQPQKFTVYPASADANGISYGTLATGTLGPGGSIKTIQKYFNRRPWDNSDFTASQTEEVYTYYCQASAGGLSNADYVNQPDLWNQYSVFMGRDWEIFPELSPHYYLREWDVFNWSYGVKSGAYAAADDTTQDVFDLLDGLGVAVQVGNLYHWTYYNPTTNTKGHMGVAGKQIVHYDINRHDYS